MTPESTEQMKSWLAASLLRSVPAMTFLHAHGSNLKFRWSSFQFWMNDRAIVYRRKYGIPAEWGTAVNVQQWFW